jgi:hypothetical protein
MVKGDGQPIERACVPTAVTPDEAYLFFTVGGTTRAVMENISLNREDLGINGGLELSIGKVKDLMTSEGSARYGLREAEDLRRIMEEYEFPSRRGENGEWVKFKMKDLKYFLRAKDKKNGVMGAVGALTSIDGYLEANRESKEPYCSRTMVYMDPTNGWSDYTPD